MSSGQNVEFAIAVSCYKFKNKLKKLLLFSVGFCEEGLFMDGGGLVLK